MKNGIHEGHENHKEEGNGIRGLFAIDINLGRLQELACEIILHESNHAQMFERQQGG